MASVKSWFKVFCQNGLRQFLDPNSTLLNFFVNLLIKFFLKLYLRTGGEKWAKVTVLIFYENSYYVQNGVNRSSAWPGGSITLSYLFCVFSFSAIRSYFLYHIQKVFLNCHYLCFYMIYPEIFLSYCIVVYSFRYYKEDGWWRRRGREVSA